MFFEVKGGGVQYDYGFRIYDSRIARFMSVDPLTASYPWYTPYQFAGNTPIWAFDIDGLEEAFATDFIDDEGRYRRSYVINQGPVDENDKTRIQFKYAGSNTLHIKQANQFELGLLSSLRASWEAYNSGESTKLTWKRTFVLTVPKLILPSLNHRLGTLTMNKEIKPIFLKERKNSSLVDDKPNGDLAGDNPPNEIPTPIVTSRILFEGNSNHILGEDYKKEISNVAYHLHKDKSLKVEIIANVGLSGLGTLGSETGTGPKALNGGAGRLKHFNRTLKNGNNRRVMWSRRARIIHILKTEFHIDEDRITEKPGSVERGSSNRTVQFNFFKDY
ncbi:MAG: RHS repeat-associated protein [Saprospiraceae bacterium]|jgi:RHS repeat-associated protein